MAKNNNGKPVAVVIGATSKWQADGRNTRLAHGKAVDDSDLPVGVRWGIGGAIAQKFAAEGFFVVLTTRTAANASALEAAIRTQGGDCTIVELDLSRQESVAAAFGTIRNDAGDPHVVVYNAGYLEGRDLPPEKRELLPAPWTTMLTLTRLDAERFDQALEAGFISPEMTNAQALALTGKTEAPEPKPRSWKSGPPKGTVTSASRLPASLLVRELQRYDPSELTPTQRHELAAWLTGGSDGTTEVDGGRELCGNIA